MVAGGEGGVDLAGVVGGDEGGFAQAGVAGLGESAVAVGLAGGVGGGDQAGEGADRGEVGESCCVAESSEDLRGADPADAGGGSDDPGRVGLVVESGDALVELVDLLGEGQREPGFDGDVGGERVEVEPAAVGSPQPERGLGGFDDRGGAFVSPRLAAGAAEERRQAGLAEAFHLNRVGVAGQEPQSGQRHIRAERGNPRRSQDLQQRVEAGHRGGAAMHQAGADLDRPFEMVPRAERVLAVHPSGCRSGRRASTFESSRSVLVCLL